MPIVPEVQRHLALQIEQYLRGTAGRAIPSTDDIVKILMNRSIPGVHATRADYLRLVNQVTNMFNTAQAITPHSAVPIRGLPSFGGIEADMPTRYFRILVVARDAAGNELWSTAVDYETSQNLSAAQLDAEALRIVQGPTERYHDASRNKGVASYETFIQLAGQYRP